MTTRTPLVTGLGGAIGSDYVQTTHQLFFVEYAGKISRFDLLRPLEATVFTGTATMPPDSSLDLQDGTSVHGGHIRWDHTDPSHGRVMRPQGNCDILNLGPVNFDALTHAELQNLDGYSRTTDIHGDPGPANQLTDGDVFAIRNDYRQPAANFDYAKVQVVHYGDSLQVRWVSYRLKPAYQVLGTGYSELEDIVVAADGQHAYVTERGGTLWYVDLAHANKANATPVYTGMTAPQQIALDEARGYAYVVEYASSARIWRIDIHTHTATPVVSGLDHAVGLLVTADGQFAYVSEQASSGGRVTRITLASGARQVIASGLTAPFLLEWTDTGQTGILITERDPANRVTLIDLTKTPIAATAVATVAFRPSSVAVVSPERLLVCCDSEIDELDLTAGIYTVGGPALLGVGLVPKTAISSDGYATTASNYIFPVVDAPFGGSLAIMVNHAHAWSAGAQYYQLLVDGVVQHQAWNDYLWSTTLNAFELQTTAPFNGSFYPVRQPGEIWYNAWLGYVLDSTALPNSPHTITVRLWRNAAALPGTEVGNAADPNQNMVLQIDNQWPRAVIEQIIYHDPANPNPAMRHRVVDACGIVEGVSDEFSFFIEADDPTQQHLKSWNLGVWWGDNKSAAIAGDSYVPGHVSPSHQWAGIHAEVPPSHWHATVMDPVTHAVDPTSRRCAHTFVLSVWDRVTNGYTHLHYVEYHKSITLLLS